MKSKTQPGSPAKNAVRASRKVTQAANKAARDVEVAVVRFQCGDRSLPFNVDLTAETVWATQRQIADLFECETSTVADHIRQIVAEESLEEKSVGRTDRQTGSDGKPYSVRYYDLDMILTVGFKVRSARARQFRRWAHDTLRSYIVHGYALNESRLRSDPSALQDLAAQIRAMRADERNVYASVRECFKVSSSDYDKNSPVTQKFYARLQNQFFYAITEKTAAQIVLARANHRLPNMGLQCTLPTLAEAKIGKNYLNADELRTLHILCETFLLYAEGKAIRRQALTMQKLADKLSELFETYDFAVFPGYRDFQTDKAVQHAQAEYALWLTERKKAS